MIHSVTSLQTFARACTTNSPKDKLTASPVSEYRMYPSGCVCMFLCVTEKILHYNNTLESSEWPNG